MTLKAQLPSFDRKFYVSKAGSDSSGVGSFSDPFETIGAAAFAAAVSGASPDHRFCIEVHPGVYDGFELPSDVWVVGTTPTLTEIAGPITIANAMDQVRHRAGLYSLRLSTPQVLDFSHAPTSYLVVEDCSFIESLHYLASADNALFFSNSFLFGGFTQRGGYVTMSGVANQNGGSINIVADGSTTFLAYGSQSNGPVSAKCASPSNLLFTLGAYALQDEATLTLDGPMVVQVSPGCCPPNVTLLNGAPSPRPVFTGSRGSLDPGVLALVGKLAEAGLITDGTTP